MKLGIISDLRNPEAPRFHRPWVHHYSEFLDLVVQRTFRPLFRPSEALLGKPPVARGGGTLGRLLHDL